MDAPKVEAPLGLTMQPRFQELYGGAGAEDEDTCARDSFDAIGQILMLES